MPDFFPTKRELTIGEIVALTARQAAAGDVRSIGASATLRRSIGARLPTSRFSTTRNISMRLAVTRAGACLLAPRFAAQAPDRLAVLVDAGALPRLRRGGARAVSRGAAAVLAVRHQRPRGRCARASFGADRGGRDHRSAGGDRTRRRNRRRHADRGRRGDRPGRRHRTRLRDRRRRHGTHALIGDRVIIHPGARIGQDGFGYLPSPRGHQKIPQTRRVIIQDDVEIGANTTIDRGSTRDTVIGEGTKIDNLVQIAHNVSIGRHCLIAGQTGISGSSQVGDFVMMGGQVGLADHVTVGAGAMLGAQSGVHVRRSGRRALGRISGGAGPRLHEGRSAVAQAHPRTAARPKGTNDGMT